MDSIFPCLVFVPCLSTIHVLSVLQMDSWLTDSASEDSAPSSLSWVASTTDLGYVTDDTDPTVVMAPPHVKLGYPHAHILENEVDDSSDVLLIGDDVFGQDLDQDEVEFVACNETVEYLEEAEIIYGSEDEPMEEVPPLDVVYPGFPLIL